MKLKENILKSKKLKKIISTTLASFLVFNAIADTGKVFANEKANITVDKVGNYMSFIADRKGGKLDIPLKKSNEGDLAYCLEGAKPHPTGQSYTEGGVLPEGIKYIITYNPNTGNYEKDYYVKQAALYYYKGHATWIQYAVQGKDLADMAIQIANEAKSKDTKSTLSITANPRQQDFKLVGDNYETDWFNVSIQGDLTSYRMDIKGAPSGTQIINASGNVVTSLTKNDSKFKLRVPKVNANGEYDIKIRILGQFVEDKAVEYIPSSSTYQRVAILKKYPTNVDDADYLNAKLVGTGTVEVTKKSENGNVLQGAEFKLVKDGIDATPIKSTDSNGNVTFNDLVPGTYQVVETKAPTGHVLNSNKPSVTISAGDTKKIDISNEIIKGKVKVTKIDEETGAKLQGAEFELKDRATGRVVEKLTTNESGIATSELHQFGEYVLQEVKSPDKYTLNGKEHFVTISDNMQTIEVTAKNRIIKGKIEVNKSDKDIEGLNLEGVEFEISNEEGKVVDTLITNENGYDKSIDLNYGKYYLKETKTLDSHLVSDKVYEVNITEDGKVYTYDIKNEVKKGKVEVIKLDDTKLFDRPLKGAEFTIYDKDKNIVDTLVTSQEGYAISKELRYGKYTMKETKAPQGYKPSDKIYEIEITENNQIVKYEIGNKIKKGKVELVKLDSELKKDLPLAGAEFTIYDLHKNEVEKLITNQDGYAISKDINYGKYIMKETKAPQGYKLSDKIYEIEITKDKQVVSFEIENDIKKGKVEVIKLDSEEKGNLPLAGAEFTIYDLHKNEVEKLITNQDGYAISKDINYGKYIMKETKAPKGYKASDTIYEINITEDKQVVLFEIENDVKKGKVEIFKKDSSTKRNLKGTEFTIYDLHRNEVDKLVTNEDGYAISKDINYGKYIMKETKAPKGYKASDKTYEIDIDKDGKIVTFEIENDVKEGEVEFSKTDVSTGEVIEGAEIKITGISDTNSHIKLEFVSTKDDKFKVPVGKYEIRETIAPNGYVLTDEVGTFEIKEDGEIVKAELKNKRIEGTLEFEKTDVSTGEVIDGAEIKIECIEGFNKGDIIEFTSSKEGNKFKLEYGKYKITETLAPEGYITTDEVGYFEISEEGQIVKAELKNQRMIIEENHKTEDVENPKTGDLGIVGIAMVSIISLVVLIFINTKVRREIE